MSGLAGGVVAIATGGQHSCALTSQGRVQCWGRNDGGNLGDGSSDRSKSIPVDVSGLTSGVTAIASGAGLSCALTAAGGVKCWGWNDYGQLGDGSTTNRSTPVDVVGLASGVAAIAPGAHHTCALTKAGGVECWGNNASGELGNGSRAFSGTPVNVTGLTSGVAAIAAGDSYSCALLRAGGVKCWGYNGNGQLGNGAAIDSSTPVDVSGLATGVTAIAASGIQYYHGGPPTATCALTAVGSVKCWGFNVAGQLGNGTKTDSSVPVDVTGLASSVTAITVGGIHSCALLSSGEVACWGTNTFGVLGDGTTIDRLTPVAVKGL